MIKPSRKIVLAAAAVALLAGAKVYADTVQFGVDAQVTDNLSAVAADMDFGTLYFSCAGDLTLATDDSITENGCVSQYAGTPAAAEITITGTTGHVIDIVLPAANATLNAGAGDNLTVDNWTSDAVGLQVTLVGGTGVVNIGADLTAAAIVADGAYSATVDPTVTFTYN